MDQNAASFLPNLHRAQAFRSKTKDSSLETNLILNHIESNVDWFHFGRRPWRKIDRISDLEFPTVTFNADQASTYSNLVENNVYNFSLGNYAIKRSLNYLNHPSYQENFFQCQILPTESLEYNIFRDRYFPGQPISVIRFRCPSYHKSSNFNVEGYRGYLTFLPVISYEPLRKDKLRLKGDWPVSHFDQIDFYFRNTIKCWFCTCKNGQRSLSSCAHILAAIIGFGAEQDFSREKFLPETAQTFNLE